MDDARNFSIATGRSEDLFRVTSVTERARDDIKRESRKGIPYRFSDIDGRDPSTRPL